MASEPSTSIPSEPGEPRVPLDDPDKLRQDLGDEYYAILDIISDYDQRLVVVKGWSVTLSLAGLGFGFEKDHYALFGLAALAALGFWYIDALFKGFQLSYYSRMRDIEVASYYLNRIQLPELDEVSAPRIDAYWSFRGFGPTSKGQDTKVWQNRGIVLKEGRWVDRREAGSNDAPESLPGDWRTESPWRRTPPELHTLLRRRWRMRQVLFPHVIAVLVGGALFALAAAGWSDLSDLNL